MADRFLRFVKPLLLTTLFLGVLQPVYIFPNKALSSVSQSTKKAFCTAKKRSNLAVREACPALIECLFSPDDHLQERFINLINQETKSIKGAIYMITDKEVAQALVDAKNRHVDVQLVIDQSQNRSSFSKVGILKKGGIPLFEYAPQDGLFNLMHNKFAIFGNKIVWTGSYNWTWAADNKNQENVTLIESDGVASQFAERFEVLKARCVGGGLAVS